jgi:hypothetical protein
LTVKYLDPYKDDPYGKLKGDKADTWFKINFDEAKLYPTDSGYILAGFFTGYAGIIRNFKASEPLVPGLCALPIYSQEYELWEKGDDGKSKPVKYQPSKFEKALSAYIESTKANWIPEGKNIGGEISFSPDAQVQNFRETDLPQFVTSSCKIEPIGSSGKLPEYTPPNTGSFTKGSGKSYGVSPVDRLAFVKKELCNSIAADWGKEDSSLGLLVNQMILEHKEDETFLAVYFDLLRAIIR